MTKYEQENKFNGLHFKKAISIKDTFTITIQGDQNDGDYLTETTNFSSYEKLQPYLTIISKIGNEITATGDASDRDAYELQDEESDLANDIIPYSEYGVHSLTLSEFVYYDERGDAYDASFQPEFFL